MRLPATLLAAAALLPLTACAADGNPFGAVRGSSKNCAELFANAMASKSAVKGSWDCLSPDIQDQFKAVGLQGDAGIEQLAQKEPVYSKEQFMGRLADGGYVYGLSGDSASSVLLVWLDKSGRVADIQTGGRGQHQ